MKKLFALALVVLGLAACQTDPSDLDVNFDGTTTVCLTLPEDAITRAGGSDSAKSGLANNPGSWVRFKMQIFDANNNASSEEFVKWVQDDNDTSTPFSVTFPVQLVPGRAYTFVAWADIVAGDGDVSPYYDTTNLNDIKLIGEWNAMDEARDAFTDKCVIDSYAGTSSINLNLKRPFAKVRVVATDLEKVTNLGLTPTKATVRYTEVAASYNALTQKVLTTTVKEHEKYTIAEYTNDNSDTQMVLYTDYIFANNEQGAVSFTIETFDQNDQTIKLTTFNTDIAVKRNMLTTIKGDIMTTSNNITVKVENPDEFANGEHEIVVKEANSASELQQIINDAEEGEETVVNIGTDIDLGLGGIILSTRAEDPAYGILVSANKVITLDLCGKTLSMNKECSKSFSMIENRGTLKIVDTEGGGKISFKDTSAGDPNFGWGSYTISNYGGTLVVENGTIEHLGEQNTPEKVSHMYCPIWQYSGSTTINGGTISNSTYRSVRLWSGDMTINGGNFNGQVWLQSEVGKANLTINDGTFAPSGADGSSVFITLNDKYVVNLAINGGFFNTKIGCSDATKEGVKGSIVGGTFTAAAKDKTSVALLADGCYFEADGENFKVISKEVAKVGENTYRTLLAAINAVEDGGTITIIDDITYNEYTRVNNGGSWYEGLLYDGDKSFTIDLNGKTITNDEYVNDYLLYFKNNGEKANTITIKNGTVTAAPSAYAAIATASSNAQKITMNLENVTINGNNSNGAVVKFRGGGELNVKAGTVITGENNYCGIEVVGTETIANIYDGAEIYQNGTTNYTGAVAGVSYGATMNVYGGKGVSAKCGLIVMTSGGTINVEGGEWTANSDGTPKDGNFGVLVSQFDNAAYPTAVPSVLNVKGGTFRGGYNCYGNVADKAFIYIYGGNFNADPAGYVVAGYEVTEENGIYNVGKPMAQVALEAAIAEGGDVTLTEDVTLVSAVVVPEGTEVVLDLDGKTVTALSTSAFEVRGGKLTLKNGNVTAHEAVVRALDGGEVVIESGNYTQTGTAVGSTPATYRYCVDVREGSKATINGGEFTSGNGMLNVNATGELVINGGKFTNVVEKSMTRHFAYVSGKLTITDGEFYGKANSSAGGCFFCGAAAGCDIKIEGGKFTSLWTSGSVNKIFEVYYGGTINVTGGLFNTNGGIKDFVTENTDEATKDAYPYVAK